MFGKDKALSDAEVMDRQDKSGKETTILGQAGSVQSEMLDRQEKKQKEDLVRWQQSLDVEMESLEHDLRREVFNKHNNVWRPLQIQGYNENGELVSVDAPPMCNEFCIMIIKSTIRPFMNKNEMMTNYSEERILIKLRNTMKTLIRNIGIKHDYYEIDFHDMSNIRQTIQNFIISSPFRALNNGERKYIQSSTRRIESINEGTPVPRKKLLGFI